MAVIEIKNLCHSFSDGTEGLKNINLAISKGELAVISGENGSGKTTLCKHLNGLLTPSSGTVLVNGAEIWKNSRGAGKLVGMVFQNYDNQIVGETVRDDIAFGPENLRLKRDEINKVVDETAEALGLTGIMGRRPHTLSGGEKRKLAIAGVLAMKPEILVFDEPFSNLDYPASLQILKQILSLRGSGRTILIVTHELEKIIAHADRLIIMRRGEIAREGAPEEIIKEAEALGVREPCSSRLGKGIMPWTA